MSTREVILEGGSPWGFRMHGGIDVHQPLRISRVNPGSKASLKGVREGDLITSINGRATKEITNSEAHTLLKSSGDRLILGLNEDCQNSPKRRQYKTILHHHHKEVVEETSKTSTSTSHTTLITTNECQNQTEPQTEETFEQTDCNDSQPEPSKISRCNGQSKTGDNFQIINENDTTTEILIDKNPFRQPLKDERKLKNQEQSQIDETPSISTITPTASPPTLTPTSSHYSSNTRGIWSPGQKSSLDKEEIQQLTLQDSTRSDESVPVIWTPKSAGSSPLAERKELQFRPVNFESPVFSRKNYSNTNVSTDAETSWKPNLNNTSDSCNKFEGKDKLSTSQSAPGLGFSEDSTHRLPKAQNPTITLLQKARQGQIPPKSATYIEQDHSRKKNESPYNSQNELIYNLRTESISDSESEKPKHINVKKQYDRIGPTTTHGMPLGLRSEIRDANMSQWYRKMYDTIHKHRPSKYDDEEYVTIRYKQRNRGKYPYVTGYLSEPEIGAYDSDAVLSDGNNYSTLDRRRTPSHSGNNHKVSNSNPARAYSSSTSLPAESRISNKQKQSETTTITYKPEVQQSQSAISLNRPGKIENYTPGKSSISDIEAKKWWDEVMDIFDGMEKQQLQQQRQKVPLVQPKGYLSQALKESGYESDSTLVFRRRDETAQQMNPQQQREVYKNIQKGGDVPLYGLRKSAPDPPKASPRKYVENEVTIHYRTPVRQEMKEFIDEQELAKRQADAMRKIYEEERQRKHLQELQDRKSRRHTDNFIQSQKSPIPLNRYDDFTEDLIAGLRTRPRSPEPRLVAKALFNFVGQSARELTFKKGDIIIIRRQIDKNWYEGELNAMVGLFPSNYVEIVPYDGMKKPTRKPNEGQARAKYNFIAKTHLELSLAKGELVVVTRKVDDNWYEGRIGGRKGIFPVSYVEIMVDPQEGQCPPTKPVASPAAHSLLLNGSAGGKESMGTHSYLPTFPTQDLGMSYRAKPVQITSGATYGSLKKKPIEEALHIDIQNEPIPYRALYKYRPQNDDELELLDGDIVQVLEKCDDGWFVGTSERTGAFGTFPGNYVEQILN